MMHKKIISIISAKKEAQASVPNSGSGFNVLIKIANKKIRSLVEDALAFIPKDHLNGLKSISTVNSRFISPDRLAYYKTRRKTIKINLKPTSILLAFGGLREEEFIKKIIIHEIGHHYYLNILTKENKEIFANMNGYNEFHTNGNEPFLKLIKLDLEMNTTMILKGSCAELFADAYAIFLLETHNFKEAMGADALIKANYGFFQDVVFKDLVIR